MVQALASHALLNEFGDEFLAMDAVFHWLCECDHLHEVVGNKGIRQEQVAKSLLAMQPLQITDYCSPNPFPHVLFQQLSRAKSGWLRVTIYT